MKLKNKIICLFVMLFAILTVSVNANIVYAATGSFSVSGGGTVTAGSTNTITITTSDCAGKFSVSASGGGSVSTSSVWVDGSETVTVTAPSSGSTTVTVTAVDVVSTSLESVTGSKSVTLTIKTTDSSTNDSSSTTTTVTKSTNNKLSSLTVSGGTLSPTFSSSVTDYTVDVSDIDSITISATKSDDDATVSGTGTKTLEMGSNEFDIKVTAESGSVKTYTVTVNLVLSPTVYLNMDDAEFGVVKDTSEVIVPDGFEETTITMSDEEVTVWINSLLDMTIVYLVDEEGNEGFYLFDEETTTISAFNPLTLMNVNVYAVDISEEEQTREGMVYSAVGVDGNYLMGWTFEDESLFDYVVIYVMNEMGEMVNYLYCISDNSMILAPEIAPVSSETYQALIDLNESLEQEIESDEQSINDLEDEIILVTAEKDAKQQGLIIACVVAGVFLISTIVLAILFVFNRGNNNSNKRYKK